MKLLSAFLRLSELEPIRKAGADEVYCGVRPLRGFGEGALPDLGTLEAAVKRAHALGLKLHLAVNKVDMLYAERGGKKLAADLRRIDDLGVDGFILASLSLFRLLERTSFRPRAELHLSSVQPCFNTAAARFLLELPVSRLILPAQLAPAEAGGILRLCRRRKVQTEIFDYRFFGCPFINGRCEMHSPEFYTATETEAEGSACRIKSSGEAGMRLRGVDVPPAKRRWVAGVAARAGRRLACGSVPRIATAAAFYDFLVAGVDYLKLGVRLDSSSAKARKVSQMRAMITLAEDCRKRLGAGPGRAAFVDAMSSWGKTG